MQLSKVDLHCHTSRSYDGWTTPKGLVRRARAVGLDRICVTDHGTIRGALEARELDAELVLVGQEIRCEGGTELLGLMIEQPIASGLTAPETAARIRGQGGLVYAPHPFAYLRGASGHARVALAVADIVEVFNPRAFLPSWNRLATRAVAKDGRPGAASSDAHFPWEVGRGYTVVAPFTSAAGLVESLGRGVPVRAGSGSPFSHVLSITLGCARKWTGRGDPTATRRPLRPTR